MIDEPEPGIVTVHLKLPPEIAVYRPRYAFLCDRSVDEILAFARTHPKCFVFPFFTRAPEDVPDCKALRESDLADWIAPPWIVFNLIPIGDAIRHVVASAFEVPWPTEPVCILNEAS